MNANKIISLVKADVRKLGTQKAVASKIGVTTSYLSEVLRGRRQVTERIAKHYGFERAVTFKRVA